MPLLFEPLTLRDLTLRNRIGLSPMCQYSCGPDGAPNDWHVQHLASRAAGGFGLIITEATAVEPVGRITPRDAGIWSDEHVAPWARVVRACKAMGASVGIQLAHAGRKAGSAHPWSGLPRGSLPLGDGPGVDRGAGGWQAVGASPVSFNAEYRVPRPLSEAEIAGLVHAFAEGARRADEAGFDVVEIHAAHGYLLHSFHSPLSNRRGDRYGGTLENRVRLTREIVAAVRAVWPSGKPLFVRLSCTDWGEFAKEPLPPPPAGGNASWTLDDSVRLAKWLRADGVDLIDCSSGGAMPGLFPSDPEPGFQTPLAARIRKEARIPTAAVGMITEPVQAQCVIERGEADLVLLGKQALREPYWPARAARTLHPEGDVAKKVLVDQYDYWIQRG